ncbi:proline-rich proteoglycan 2-like [Cervus canadensis]|uniref:proline-rich proteoglycan 2-like n=1 Tax=Cervus canadensis TaxID=1574408 RepID=UPI001CA323D0|nr:proline-rich proteoglycan 2-like [Cervus canadensis]
MRIFPPILHVPRPLAHGGPPDAAPTALLTAAGEKNPTQEGGPALGSPPPGGGPGPCARPVGTCPPPPTGEKQPRPHGFRCSHGKKRALCPPRGGGARRLPSSAPARGSPAGPSPSPALRPPARLAPSKVARAAGYTRGCQGGTPHPGAGGADPADPPDAARSHPPPVHPRLRRAAPLGLRLGDQNMKGMATSPAKPHSEGKECRQVSDSATICQHGLIEETGPARHISDLCEVSWVRRLQRQADVLPLAPWRSLEHTYRPPAPLSFSGPQLSFLLGGASC